MTKRKKPGVGEKNPRVSTSQSSLDLPSSMISRSRSRRTASTTSSSRSAPTRPARATRRAACASMCCATARTPTSSSSTRRVVVDRRRPAAVTRRGAVLWRVTRRGERCGACGTSFPPAHYPNLKRPRVPTGLQGRSVHRRAQGDTALQALERLQGERRRRLAGRGESRRHRLQRLNRASLKVILRSRRSAVRRRAEKSRGV